MYEGQVDVISNKATWRSQEFELIDDDDGTTTDLTAVADLAIEVTIKNIPSPGCTPTALVTASIDNGKVTVPGPGFQWQFEDTDLTGLCPGTYRLGVKVTMDDFIVDLIIGTISVLEGN